MLRNAPLPQLDRGTDYESVRRGFESLTAHHPKCLVASSLLATFFVFLRSQIGAWGQSGGNSEKSGAYSVEDFAERICGFPVRILECMTINIQCGCCLLTPPHFLGIAISAGKNRTVCIPFSPNAGNKPPLPGNIFALCMLFEIVMARSSPHVSISRRNQAIRAYRQKSV